MDAVAGAAWALRLGLRAGLCPGQETTLLASGSFDQAIKLWNVTSGDCRSTLEGHMGLVTGLAWSPESRTLASATEEGAGLVWRAVDGVLLQRFEHAGNVNALCWSPDGEYLVSGSVDGKQGVLSIWNVRQGRLVRKLESHSGSIMGVEWFPQDNTLLSAGADGTMRWWDPQQGVQLARVQAHEG